MTEPDIRILSALGEIAGKLHVNLVCSRCAWRGLPDRITTNNDPNGATWTATCNCTTRVHRRRSA